MVSDLSQWEVQFIKKIKQVTLEANDSAHDFLHFQRVVNTAKKLCIKEGALMEVVLPASWLHDLVIMRKDDPMRSQASRLAAESAVEYLKSIGYPEQYLNQISHAIESHSYSANIKAETLEAQIVQDADRLDGLGAIGIARCFATGGMLNRIFYSDNDPFCETRIPDDNTFTVDHFYKKLFKISNTLHTNAAKEEAAQRVEHMKIFLLQLSDEINVNYESELAKDPL